MRAWRISKARYAATAFDGEGARLNGGRWSSVGTRVAYASESVALATLEVLVGLQDTAVLPSYSLIAIEFPEDIVETLDPTALPAAWNHHPPSPDTQRVGDLWVTEARSVVLKVPSAVVEAEHNYLINPQHPAFARVLIHAPKAFDLTLRACQLQPLVRRRPPGQTSCETQKGISCAKAILFSTVESRTLGMGRGPFGAALEPLAAEAHSVEWDSRVRGGLVWRRRAANLAGDGRTHEIDSGSGYFVPNNPVRERTCYGWHASRRQGGVARARSYRSRPV